MGQAERNLLERLGFPGWCGVVTVGGEDMSAVPDCCAGGDCWEILPDLLPMVSSTLFTRR